MKRKREKRIILLLFVLLAATVAAFATVVSSQPEEETANYGGGDSGSPAGLSAADLLDSINVGYNIGNSLDSCPGGGNGFSGTDYYETYLGNPVITKEFVNAVKQAGFNAVRIPVAWSGNASYEGDRLVIRKEWLDRVEEVVGYAISDGLYVILNTQNDESILWADMEDIDAVSGSLRDLWGQLAERFKDYDEKLVFESFGNIVSKDKNRQFSEGPVQAANILNQLFVDTVRAGGGLNGGRVLICGTYAGGAEDAILNAFELPSDSAGDRLAVGVHSYSQSYSQDIKGFFETLGNHSERIGAPIVITEFGTSSSFIPAEYRAHHAGNFVACAGEYGIKCFWWDDGDKYRLFDRKNNELVCGEIAESLMNPAEFKINKVSTNVFSSIESYSYALISPLSGALKDSHDGVLTLNPAKQGFPVIYGYGYHIRLEASGSAEGLRLSGLCFYDSRQNIVKYLPIEGCSSYDVTPPDNASFMRISFRKPSEPRLLEEYISYFEKLELRLEITEYIK